MAVKDGGFKMMGEEHIAMLLYPGFTALDLVGPHYLFSSMMGAKIYLLTTGDDLAPITCGEGLTFVPTHTASDCPKALDILFVPGGANGTLEAMKNPAIIDLIAQKAAFAKYITSVCTGSLLLGKAGLLKGKKATSHWVTLDLLAEFGAIPTRQRVVWDGNVVTGGGVTAGIDFGLEIVAALRGKLYAEALQLQGEYDPAPPFNAGAPDKAPAFVRDTLQGMFAPLVENFRRAIKPS
ncbi:MAG: DJ-1/PfpI family protein [Methylococcaceae bacterium]|nr:DJ-1/PfpI family protein [Methylococcaceae bacterium]